MTRAVAAIGDVTDPACWSGLPYHFWRAGRRAGFADTPVRLSLDWLATPRRLYALGQLARGCRPGGFQYSRQFLDRAERLVPQAVLAGEIISFNQHFPRAATVRAAGGRVSYYVDATFAALSTGRGLDLRLPADVARAGRRLERENYAAADRVISMARWTADSLRIDCGVPSDKLFTVLPGANIEPPEEWMPPGPPAGRPGVDREFVLGFVGKDWRRKGLPLVCEVRDRLATAGWRAEVRAAGATPPGLETRQGVRFVGFLDKRTDAAGFLAFLAGCDVGCLFSDREALGVSTLEFLRAGVPVAGYAHEGPADTLPPDAGFRFPLGAPTSEVVARLGAYLADPGDQARIQAAARQYSDEVTWDRCVREFQEVWACGRTDRMFHLVPPGTSGVTE